eukprot:8578912-Pyramimonas_sp.AAC.1
MSSFVVISIGVPASYVAFMWRGVKRARQKRLVASSDDGETWNELAMKETGRSWSCLLYTSDAADDTPC